MYFYVYKLEHIETGEYYFGSRGSKLHPTNDCYFGSMKVWKPDKNKLKKLILKDDFSNRSEAINFERNLITEHIGKELNRNYNIPGTNFYVHQDTFNNKNHQIGNKNSQFGTCWVHSNNESKKIKKNEILPDGWKYGRTEKPTYVRKKGQKGDNNSQFGTCWITNGFENKKLPKIDPLPNGWIYGCINFKMIGYHWITNGKENKKIKKESPEIPDGWYKGRVLKHIE